MVHAKRKGRERPVADELAALPTLEDVLEPTLLGGEVPIKRVSDETGNTHVYMLLWRKGCEPIQRLVRVHYSNGDIHNYRGPVGKESIASVWLKVDADWRFVKNHSKLRRKKKRRKHTRLGQMTVYEAMSAFTDTL